MFYQKPYVKMSCRNPLLIGSTVLTCSPSSRSEPLQLSRNPLLIGSTVLTDQGCLGHSVEALSMSQSPPNRVNGSHLIPNFIKICCLSRNPLLIGSTVLTDIDQEKAFAALCSRNPLLIGSTVLTQLECEALIDGVRSQSPPNRVNGSHLIALIKFKPKPKRRNPLLIGSTVLTGTNGNVERKIEVAIPS